MAEFQGGRADGNRPGGDKPKRRISGNPAYIRLTPDENQLAHDLGVIASLAASGPDAEVFAKANRTVLIRQNSMLDSDCDEVLSRHGIAFRAVEGDAGGLNPDYFAADPEPLLRLLQSRAAKLVLNKCRTHEHRQKDKFPETSAINFSKNVASPLPDQSRARLVLLEKVCNLALGKETTGTHHDLDDCRSPRGGRGA